MSQNQILREQILSAPDRLPSTEPVPTPEWPQSDGKIHVMPMSGDQRDMYETSMAARVDRKTRRLRANTAGIRASVVAMGACDSQGNLIFAGDEDVAALGGKNGAVLDRLFDAIRKISGLDAAETESSEKNSAATTGDDSSSA